jgi:hypothetical protein
LERVLGRGRYTDQRCWLCLRLPLRSDFVLFLGDSQVGNESQQAKENRGHRHPFTHMHSTENFRDLPFHVASSHIAPFTENQGHAELLLVSSYNRKARSAARNRWSRPCLASSRVDRGRNSQKSVLGALCIIRNSKSTDADDVLPLRRGRRRLVQASASGGRHLHRRAF